jgi:outer membrane biosynthesis protein TonB
VKRSIWMKTRALVILLLAGALPLAGASSIAEQWVAHLKEVDQKLRAQQWEQAEKQVLEVADQIVAGTGQKHIQPPKIIRRVRPRFPEGLRQMGVSGNLWVEAIIGEDGVPREPLVVDARGVGPAMKYVALEALRQWRFEPARLEGKPVKVYYVLDVNFKYKS